MIRTFMASLLVGAYFTYPAGAEPPAASPAVTQAAAPEEKAAAEPGAAGAPKDGKPPEAPAVQPIAAGSGSETAQQDAGGPRGAALAVEGHECEEALDQLLGMEVSFVGDIPVPKFKLGIEWHPSSEFSMKLGGNCSPGGGLALRRSIRQTGAGQAAAKPQGETGEAAAKQGDKSVGPPAAKERPPKSPSPPDKAAPPTRS